MRECFFDPVSKHPSLSMAEYIAKQIYGMHEAGSDYSAELRQLGKLAGRIVSLQNVMGAFGSISPTTFARKCLVNWGTLPSDATEDEMLEMLQLICQAKGSEFQVEYWVQCLRVNTGNDRISDLIFWPDEYFGHPIIKEPTASEMLAIALGRPVDGYAV